MKLSVVIPTHEPRPDFLERVLAALRAQGLPLADWELIVVDNASPTPPECDLSWHPSGRLVRESALGLQRARLRGFAEARGDVVVLVDDDNLLDPGYLAAAAAIAADHPFLGAWSGAITLEYEDPAARPPALYEQFLTTRTVGQPCWSNDPTHNASTPWGAGLCVRRAVFEAYGRLVAADPRRAGLDLQGKRLLYGGDTDIAFTGCSIGLGKGVFPTLHLTHLIPRRRCEIEGLLRSAEGQAYSEILHGYLLHGTVAAGRRDLLGRIGSWARYAAAGADARRIESARRRGYAAARSELSAKAP